MSYLPPFAMADPKHLDLIAERVERLLLRHEELQRTNALLMEQVNSLRTERDSLKSRLNAARSRIDALLERFPATQESESPKEAP
jgi:cell division protein ZapB